MNPREVDYAKPLPHDEQRELVRRYQEQGDLAARDRLIETSMKLVLRFALPFTGRRLPIEDLLQEGAIGLMEAIDHHDLARDTRFNTVAVYWIKRRIDLALMDQGNTIRVPQWAHHAMRYGRVNGKDWDRGSEDATKALAMCSMRELGPSCDFPHKLNERLYDDGDVEQLNACLLRLPKRERSILRTLYGLDGDGEKKMPEIAATLGISRQRVMELRNRAMRKLTHLMRGTALGTCA